MSQTQYPWYGLYAPVAPGGFHAPWMVSSAPYHIPPYCMPTVKRAPRNSDLVRDGTGKEQVRSKQNHAVQRTTFPTRPKAVYPYARFWTSFKELIPGSRKEGASNLDAHPLPFTPHGQRKADGRSHPTANRTQVRHSTSQRITPDENEPPKSLRRTDDNARRRVRSQSGGAHRPAPHPHSYDWSWPQFTAAQYVRLHPYLQHRCNGPAPIAFDIARGPLQLQHARQSLTHTATLDLAQLAQPATQPPVRHMHIRSVAEDPLPHFPWPIEVSNAHGITCGDVLDAISRAFFGCVGESEFHTWTAHRQGAAARAYYRRASAPVVDGGGGRAEPHPHVDHDADRVHEAGKACKDARHDVRGGLRRIDYMGDRVLFHGLEQASALVEDTWFMYVGANERSKL